MIISSLQNPSVKKILKLSKSRERKLQNLFVIEGARELSLALAGDYFIEEVYVCRELFAESRYPEVLADVPTERVIDITPQVFEKLSYRSSSDGIIALARPKSHNLSDIQLSETLLLLFWNRWKNPAI